MPKSTDQARERDCEVAVGSVPRVPAVLDRAQLPRDPTEAAAAVADPLSERNVPSRALGRERERARAVVRGAQMAAMSCPCAESYKGGYSMPSCVLGVPRVCEIRATTKIRHPGR